MNIGRIVMGVAAVALAVFVLISLGQLVEVVDASEIVLIQSVGGDLTWHTTPGPVWQGFGKVTRYNKRGMVTFKGQRNPDGSWSAEDDLRLKMSFNDGGEAMIDGSINYEMPGDVKLLTALHSNYPSQDLLEQGLIQPALNKTIFLTGQLMSSQESYQERRSQIVQYVEDQVQRGVYLTSSAIREVEDASGGKRQTRVAEIVNDASGARRAETGQLERFGVRAYNFAIEDLDYSGVVDKQIADQQALTGAVQTAIARAREAAQDELTAKARGSAAVAQAEAEQQAKNATLVQEAEGRRQVAERDRQAADQERQATILRAQGDAEARRLAVAADNALDRRLQAMERINQTWAQAFAGYQGAMVPTVSLGGNGANGTAMSGMEGLMTMMMAQMAQQLGVNLNTGRPQAAVVPSAGPSRGRGPAPDQTARR